MNKQEKRTAREALRQGFTLIEILVVVAIIGMLGAVAVPAYMNYLKDSKITAARELINNVGVAVKGYYLKHSKYPDDLNKLVEEVNDEGEPYLEGDIVDPWGNDLRYEKPSKGKRLMIISNGPDGEPDTEDDITNIDDKKKKK